MRRGTMRTSMIDMTGVYQEIKRQEMLMPPKYRQNFKIKYGRKLTDQTKKKFVTEVREDRKAEFLLHALDTNPLLREICDNEILLLVVNSAVSQGLASRITDLLRSSQVSSSEAVLLYTSENKIKAMEDCIHFSPDLFRISKSVVVSEPIIPFIDQVKIRMAREGHSYSHGGPPMMATPQSTPSGYSVGASNRAFGQPDYLRETIRNIDPVHRPSMKPPRKTIAGGRQASMTLGRIEAGSANPFRKQSTRRRTQYQD